MFADSRPSRNLARASSARPSHKANLYFAAVPPPDVIKPMSDAWARLGTGASFRHDKLHLTLLGVHKGDEPPVELLDKLCGMKLAPRVGAFELQFDQMMAFHDAIVLARSRRDRLPGYLAYDLHRAALRQAVVTTPLSRLNPHVTLAYGGGLADPRALHRPIRWTVDEVFLALKRPDGSPLRRLARWRLPMKGAIRLEEAERYVSRPVQLALPGLFSD
ncbi:2'-5' RNA ligase family protein [Sandaracinobacter neustonicus]|uniref:2'-5' RNA ligase family protein n=1 Tax=Sandaracinobacter neustonicus TaxID=1715348 RepID=A0A501XL18_9SPHN|nr:2'-5' RNA ligase family protein [Sandaracinobacter neustonicus]TPE61145.1 2'-5' RNA ligase family protein [Sandaracinobacter neustonicus]